MIQETWTFLVKLPFKMHWGDSLVRPFFLPLLLRLHVILAHEGAPKGTSWSTLLARYLLQQDACVWLLCCPSACAVFPAPCTAGRNILSSISNLCCDEEAHRRSWRLIYLFCETSMVIVKKVNDDLSCSWGGSLIVFPNPAVTSWLQEAVSWWKLKTNSWNCIW